MNHYIILPASWITTSLLTALRRRNSNREFIPIFDDDGNPTTFFVGKIDNIYDDDFIGFRKFTEDQVGFIIASILDGTEQVSDYYIAKP